MQAIEIIEFDGALCLVFPDDMVTRLKLKAGDEIVLTDTADGFLLAPTHVALPLSDLDQDISSK